jgi:hypothetical protein
MDRPDPEIAKRLQGLLANHRAESDGWTSPEGRSRLCRASETFATAAREHFGGALARSGFPWYRREAGRIPRGAVHAGRPVSVGLHAAPSSVLAEMIRWGVVPGLLIDSSPANAPLRIELRRWGAMILNE